MESLNPKSEGMDADDWREYKKATQKRHYANKEKNLKILVDSGLNFVGTNNNECIVFREIGMPVVDFYPSTGRWHQRKTDVRKAHTFNGGALSFLNWYKKQGVKSETTDAV